MEEIKQHVYGPLKVLSEEKKASSHRFIIKALSWSDKTINSYKYAMGSFLRNYLNPLGFSCIYDAFKELSLLNGDTSIKSIIHKYLDDLYKKEAVKSTAKFNLAAIFFGLMSCASSNEEIDEVKGLSNYIQRLVDHKMNFKYRGRGSWMSIKELNEILDKMIYTNKNVTLSDKRAAVFILCMFSGRRVSEVARLTIDDVIDKNNKIILHISNSKTTNDKRFVAVPNRNHYDIIREYVTIMRDKGKRYLMSPLYNEKSEFVTENALLRMFARVQKKYMNKVTHTTHSIRRGLVTEAFNRNIPMESIKDNTLHASFDMLMVYRAENSLEKSSIFDL